MYVYNVHSSFNAVLLSSHSFGRLQLQTSLEFGFYFCLQISQNGFRIEMGKSACPSLPKYKKTLKFGKLAQPNSISSTQINQLNDCQHFLIYRNITTPSLSYAHEHCCNPKKVYKKVPHFGKDDCALRFMRIPESLIYILYCMGEPECCEHKQLYEL